MAVRTSGGVPNIVSRDELARIFGVTDVAIHSWEAKGLKRASSPRVRKITYDTVLAIEWYLNYKGRGKEDGNNIGDERARKEKAHADKLEMENQVRAGQLVPVEDVAARWTEHVRAARSQLLALPTKLAPLLMGCSSIKQVKAELTEHIDAALRQLSTD